MNNLINLGIFFAGFFGGFGIFCAGVGFLWWCSLYKKINLPKKKGRKIKHRAGSFKSFRQLLFSYKI